MRPEGQHHHPGVIDILTARKGEAELRLLRTQVRRFNCADSSDMPHGFTRLPTTYMKDMHILKQDSVQQFQDTGTSCAAS
jgi:hypothetical protein